ncbi:hypothetical protein BXZ70DRAFT_943231 [Cristinia sonorae]|uniref:Histone deacetylase interacting domain-containing protein n=1 Tax=Cristinia sonorae TaxID=1940300 RepID=A0A8K0UM70_9AGAR|nr:hypothetical protein BXZ70DRAFT_943231 [Cristinia sonorae]
MQNAEDNTRLSSSALSPSASDFPQRSSSNGAAREDTNTSRTPAPTVPPVPRSPQAAPIAQPQPQQPRAGPSRPRTPRQPATPPPGPPVNGTASLADNRQLPGQEDSSPDPNRPLNVTDALTYLDAVKMQFQDKPDVYNHFLDIMKDFKSQQIDTPGVIERVSALFQGNPYLIQGFNTFLPPGYRIELTTDRNTNTITVTTPLGVLTQTTNAFGAPIRIPREPHPHNIVAPYPHTLPFGPPPPVLPVGLGPGSRSATPMSHQHALSASAFVDMANAPYSPALHGAQTAAAANLLGGLGNRTVERAPAGEFNHAIQFLNKIKLRYGDEPDTYKQFLEILQTYQKEQRQLHDSQVFAQVSMLFKNAPDLMEEFKDFLPEAMGPGAQHTGLIGIMPHPTGPGWDPAGGPSPMVDGGEKAAKVPPSRRRKRAADKEPVAPPPQKAGTGRATKRAKLNHKPETGSPQFASYEVPPSPPPAHLTQHAVYTQRQQQTLLPHGQTILPPNVIPGVPGPILSTQEELIFFDHVKKALETGGTYDEFLKLLNMFSRDIIDVRSLIERAEVFLGDSELMVHFKVLMGYDEKYGNVEYGPPGSIRTGAPDPLAAHNPEDGESPSYRLLPSTEVRLACSGRDQLHRSVLNDAWVSHPTWASEEAGFMTHKKNVFEDTLHKSEEERHEYQVHIEAILRTIAVLDPLNVRISEMSAEERQQFRLKPNLGGPSRAIYEKMIKKVYGREAGMEVIKALHECPGVAVPVVLVRLKQKCDEWKRLQREWSRTWREVDAKNFYKALDHQGITFKANDKKNITSKSFVHEIETARAEFYKNREELGLPLNTHEPCSVALQYEFTDTAVLHDSLKMVYSFLDHSQSTWVPSERRAVERFLRSFVPVLFMFSSHEFNAACGPLDPAGGDDEQMDVVEGSETTEDNRNGAGGRHSAGGSQSQSASTGVAAGDLRKRLLKTVQEDLPDRLSNSKESSSLTGGSASPAGPGSPVTAGKRSGGASEEMEARSKPEDVWIREMATLTQDGVSGFAGDAPVARRPFFANTAFYTLLRLLQLLYSRLLACKETGAQLAREKHASLQVNPVAVALGLDEPNGPSVVLEQAMEAVGGGGGHGDGEVNVLYMYLLDACEKVFENELDQATFEEHMRWFFGTKAYQVFTLDRVITAIIKQVQAILGDHKGGQELLPLLQKSRNKEKTSVFDMIRYRREAERCTGADEHLYRVDWDVGSRTLRIQLVGAEEPSVGEEESREGRWRSYVASYTSRYATEWVSGRGRRPYLKRCAVMGAEDVVVSGGMAVGVGVGSYELRYGRGSTETMWRRRVDEQLRRRAVERADERRRCRILK